MTMTEGVQFIRDLMVILLAATAGGWGARRLGLSPLVGYLGAGLVIGTPEITFIYVTDPVRIQVLSQVGLVLLMFAIGTGIRIRDVKALGIRPVVATVLSALLMLTLGRATGTALGLDRLEGLFFASMLMVSSSAIIGKILTERRMLHQRVGQLALSQTLLEDFVAIVMLAVLGSAAVFGQEETASGGIAGSLAKLAGFVLLVFITGLVLLPRAMSRVRQRAGEEMHILLAAGMVFAFAFLSVLAGYSLALGAFLFGMLMSESAHQHAIARSFSGMRDIFAAIFFVSIGMGINLSLMPDALPLILWGSLLALAGRAICVWLAWMAACETAPLALRTAFHLTPIGEFSFIIASFGVASGVLAERFQVAAVGIAFVSSVVAPVLIGGSDRFIRLAGIEKSGRTGEWLQAYRNLFQRFGQQGSGHILWKLLKKRFWQVGRELAWLAAVMVFAQPVYRELEALAAGSEVTPVLTEILPWFWLAVFLLLLIPIVSVIRNIQAISMLVVDYHSMNSRLIGRYRRTWTFLLQTCGVLLLILLLGNVLPWWLFERWTILALIAVSFLIMLLGWNRLIRLHSQAEIQIQEAFAEALPGAREGWQRTGQTWGLVLEECTVPDESPHTGRTIGDLGLRRRTGATVIGIERQQVHLDQPGPGTHLFPGDRVFLIGQQEQVAKALELLSEHGADTDQRAPDLDHAILESVRIPESAAVAGKQLQELNWARLHGVQVVAARTDRQTIFSPSADWVIPKGAELLLAGSPKALEEMKSRFG
jgi:CPA2 family monovalent cation:H+ antiporter-2